MSSYVCCTRRVLQGPIEPSQHTSAAFRDTLTALDLRASMGRVGSCHDYAFAETPNGLYKTECVYGPDSRGWDDVDELELATLSWVPWFNEDRLHARCGDIPPAEYEAASTLPKTHPAGVGIQSESLHQTQGGSLAGKLLRQSAGLRAISQVLRQQDLATTALYAEVDLATTRSRSPRQEQRDKPAGAGPRGLPATTALARA